MDGMAFAVHPRSMAQAMPSNIPNPSRRPGSVNAEPEFAVEREIVDHRQAKTCTDIWNFAVRPLLARSRDLARDDHAVAAAERRGDQERIPPDILELDVIEIRRIAVRDDLPDLRGICPFSENEGLPDVGPAQPFAEQGRRRARFRRRSGPAS